MSKQKYTLITLTMLLMVGCVNHEKEIATYRNVLDEKTPTTCPAFQSNDILSLEQALILANLHNEQLALRGEDYLQILIDKDRVFAAFLPTISLNPTYFRQEKVKTSGVAGLLAPPIPSHTFDLPITAQMNIFNGFRDVAAIKRAEANIDQQKALLLDLQQTILLEVAQTYYQVIRSEQEVKVLKNSVAVQEDRVRDIKSRQQVGLARKLDVFQTEAQASATSVSLIQAKTNAQNGRSVLAFLMGQPAVNGPLTDHFQVPPRIPEVDELKSQAAENRKDLLTARAQIQAAQENLQAAIRQYFPSASLNVNYFLSRETLPKDIDWNGIININLPIFTGGIIHANIRTAWSMLRQAKLNESLTRRKINQDVQIAIENLHASRRRLNELKVELDAATEAYNQADESYKVGLATNLERLIAQDRLLISQLQLTSEQFTHKVFYLNLLKSIGQITIPPATGKATTLPATRQAHG